MKASLFEYSFCCAEALDIGLVRSSNQDQTIAVAPWGFFAVSDGMGGLSHGGETSEMIARVMPGMVEQAAAELADGEMSAQRAGEMLRDAIELVSDSIYETGNTEEYSAFGATFSGVWLIGKHAAFVNIGDSRGYMLDRYDRELRQVTEDHNIAQVLVNAGELTRTEARYHPSSCQLTRFVGMQAPAAADIFVEEVEPGDRILLCSDGLYGEVEDGDMKGLMRSSTGPRKVCSRLVEAAKENGGNDNIAVVYLQIRK